MSQNSKRGEIKIEGLSWRFGDVSNSLLGTWPEESFSAM